MSAQQKRLPAVPRKISEIKPEDRRVSVIGTIVGADGNTVVVDDGTGKLNVEFESPVDTAAGNLVRVFGRVMPTENGADLQGEVLQEMKGLDLEMAGRIESLRKNA